MKEIKEHFESNMLNWESVKEWRTMLEAKSVLEYIQEFYDIKKEDAKTSNREMKTNKYMTADR